LTILPESIVSGDSSVGSFSFNDAVFVHEDGSHEAKRSISLSDNVRLDVSVVVLASPDETTAAFEDLGDHVVNESVLVVNTLLDKEFLEVLLIDFMEDVLEPTVVSFQDCVLGREFERHSSVQ